MIADGVVAHKARLTEAARRRIESLEAIPSAMPLTFSLDEDDRVTLIAGDGLRRAPLANGADDGLVRDREWHFEAARAFLRENQSLYFGENLESDLGFLDPGGFFEGVEPGEWMIELQQMHQGVAVRQGDLKAFFIDGSLYAVSGRFHDPARFRTAALRGIDEVRAEWERELSTELAPGDTYFDVERNAFVHTAIEDLRENGARQEHLFDAVTGELLETRSAGLHSGEVTKEFWTHGNPNGSYFGNSGWRLETAPAYCIDSGSGTCGVPGSGICRYLPNRRTGKGDYVDRSLYTWAGSSAQQVFKDAACGNQPFDSWSWPDYRFFVTNASYKLNQAADIKNHGYSYFYYGHQKYALDLHLYDYNIGGAGMYYPGSKTIAFEQSQWPNNNLPNGAELLGVIAHEYGHYIHDTYGLDGTSDLVEGWADQNVYRFAVHQRFVSGEWPDMDYFTWGNRHDQQLVNGEYRQDRFPNGDETNFYYPGESCSPSSFDPYGCGAVIGITYWELAHNRSRLGYGNAYHGQKIVSSGPYASMPWGLTNSAYAYALWMATSGTDTGDFINLAANRYAQFQATYNYLSIYDYWRVLSVLEHHRTGPSAAGQQNLHRLPGSPLPSSRTHKKLFFEAENWIYPYGLAQVQSAPNTASGDERVRFDTKSAAYYSVYLPQSGSYRIRYLAAPTSPGPNRINVYAYDGQGWRGSSLCGGSGWRWCDGPVIGPLNAGTNYLWLGTWPGNDTYLLDAFVLEKL